MPQTNTCHWCCDSTERSGGKEPWAFRESHPHDTRPRTYSVVRVTSGLPGALPPSGPEPGMQGARLKQNKTNVQKKKYTEIQIARQSQMRSKEALFCRSSESLTQGHGRRKQGDLDVFPLFYFIYLIFFFLRKEANGRYFTFLLIKFKIALCLS